MKTRTLLQLAGSILLLILLNTGWAGAQIPIQGFVSENEGVASWDADGSGPEPEAYGHELPFGWGSSYYYAASLDYIGIQGGAMAHFLDNISGFPLFVQALSDNGFSASQVKVKYGMASQMDDLEGVDWFNINEIHYYNRYNGTMTIELNGEPMIFAYLNFNNVRNVPPGPYWATETNFTTPFNISEGSSPEVKLVAEAFMADMDGEELRVTTLASAQIPFDGNGRDGYKFNIEEGYLEKGLPELPYEGNKADHEGVAAWNADTTAPEPSANGHCYTWSGTEYCYLYYAASRDYGDIDPDPDACMAHFTDALKGFPNLEIQLAYRGYTIDQFKMKIDTLSLGSDIEGEDWGIDAVNNIHWYNYYGGDLTFEIAGEPVFSTIIDTAFHYHSLGNTSDWSQYSNHTNYRDISSGASSNAQYVVRSFLKDLSGHNISFTHDGSPAYEIIDSSGRSGSFYNIWGSMTAKQPSGTHVWGPEVSGTWDLAGSPYIVMDYIIIPDGETLVIEPGVEVKFNTTERFDVQGCLLADGTEDARILFTALVNDIPWGGIFFDQTPASNDASEFMHCIFEYGYGYGVELGYNCGGALTVNMVDKLTISNCTFRYNRADNLSGNIPAGGAVALFSSSFAITHCIFHDNVSEYGGALFIDINANPVVDNCLFHNNESLSHGGAVFVYEYSSPHFINCIFADNHSINAGGAFELETGGEVSFTNCILWGNKADNGYDQINNWPLEPPVLNMYYCNIEGLMDEVAPGFPLDSVNVFSSDPKFFVQGEYPYVPLNTSPTVNGGTLDTDYLPENYVCPATCLCGNPRVCSQAIDVGCYEWTLVGADDISDEQISSISIYPNPCRESAGISYQNPEKGKVMINAYDLSGRKVMKITDEVLPAGSQTARFNVSGLPNGIYLIHMQLSTEQFVGKLVVHH